MFSSLKKLFLFSLTFIVIPPYILDFSNQIPGSSVADLYPVHGLDVSHYQGNIDWKKLAETKLYHFVYMKATESHDFVDNKFKFNWENARQNNIIVGAYHFFTMRSSGISQANYFISYVPKETDSLPPAIDLEINFHQDPKRVRSELTDMITALHEHYQKQPIVYVNYTTYEIYLKGYFDPQEIWIRDTYRLPELKEQWLFWQYTDKGRVLGIKGNVDKNVFNGDLEQLQNYVKPPIEPEIPNVFLQENGT